jgi:aldose 1-epimerase
MSFSIDIQSISTFKRIRITDDCSNVYIDIISKGGLLNSWVQSNNWNIIDGNKLEHGWSEFEANGFKGGKMNPFSCRLFNGQYKHLSKDYTIEKFYLGKHALHGIIYDAHFEIEETTINTNCASVLLTYHYQKSDKGFPFEYSIQIKWSLFENNLVTAETILTNKENMVIPMMDGWHPYFKLQETINECGLQFNCEGILEYDEELIPTGNIIPDNTYGSKAMIGTTQLDNGYLLDKNNSDCILENDLYTLIVKPDKNYPYLQLYTPPHRKSIAIENLSAAPDSLNNKMGLYLLQPQEQWTLTTAYQLITKSL